MQEQTYTKDIGKGLSTMHQANGVAEASASTIPDVYEPQNSFKLGQSWGF